MADPPEELVITPLKQNGRGRMYYCRQAHKIGRFSTCGGLIWIPTPLAHGQVAVFDLNIAPTTIAALFRYFNLGDAAAVHYFVSHCHMDHIAHVWKWEQLGAQVYLPEAYSNRFLTDITHFLKRLGFLDNIAEENYRRFPAENQFHPCKSPAKHYSPGTNFQIGRLEVDPIPLDGHGLGHTGFLFPDLEILHLSCLGYDRKTPQSQGFGPWYGFAECSLAKYLQNIAAMEQLYAQLSSGAILTNSHSHIIYGQTTAPFAYMRNKIQATHTRLRQLTQADHVPLADEEAWIAAMQARDAIFPKDKLPDWLKPIYALWEYWHLKFHYPWMAHQHVPLKQPPHP